MGADAAGAILAETPYLADELTLLVDVGTNAEIVLGNRDRLLAASSPTGPAFEGAQISCGQRAAPGAIERVRIDRETLEPRFKVIGSSRWSDEPGFAASTRRTGITGRLRVGDRGGDRRAVPRRRHHAGRHDRRVDGGAEPARRRRTGGRGRTSSTRARRRRGEGLPGSPRLAITQNDVRAIQLAKAALYAGARLLMDHLGVETVDRVKLAGAFGSQIDPLHALILGLVPDAPIDRVGPAGNAAGTGALIALLSGEARREIEAVVRTVEKIETAIEPRFQEHFVDAMAIPHRTAPTPNLAAAVDLPPRRSAGVGRAGGATGAGRARRRRPTIHGRRVEPAADGRRRDGGTLMHEGPRHRTGGRAGRMAARLAAHVEASPFLTRALKPFEVLDEEGLSLLEENADTILEEVGIEFRGDPDALRLLREAGADVDRRAGPLPARDVPPDRPGLGAAGLHPARPQPRADRQDRRSVHGPRPELRLAVRPRPGQRPPLRDDRGLPELREAHLHEPVPPPLGRDGLRAGGRAGQQAPPGHGLFAHPVLGQAVHGLGHPPVAGRGHRRDGEDRVRRGLRPRQHRRSSA